jgi:murein DD-endopeptidase MepM/ murein hydrolase activator NlpD
VAAGLLASLAAPAGAADDDVVARRDEARRQQAALAAEVDVLNASEAELQGALDAIAVQVAGQEVEVERADVALAEAEEALAGAEAELRATSDRIAELKIRVVDRAVDSFINPAASTFYVVVESSGPAEAGRKAGAARGRDGAGPAGGRPARGRRGRAPGGGAGRRRAAGGGRGTPARGPGRARRAGAGPCRGGRHQGRRRRPPGRRPGGDRHAAAAEAELNAVIATRLWEEAQRRAEERRAVVAAGRCLWPTSGSPTSEYGTRWGRLHAGIDIAAPTGTPIWAALPGTVIVAGSQSGYGNTVVLDHGGGKTTLYAHQSRIAVRSGQEVDKGQVVGFVGSTGHSTGPHLHFETRSGGAPRNPRSCLG